MKICGNVLCRKPHDEKYGLCAECKHERAAERNRSYNERRAEHHSFYKTKAWRELRLIKLSINPACEVCLEHDRLTTQNLHIHHIVELATDYDLRLNLSNLQTVCRSCHNRIHK